MLNVFPIASADRARPKRRGAILVWFVLMLSLLLAMTGLVIDAGLLMATHRHVQNSVDAAAIAAADDLVRGKTAADATTTAEDYVKLHNGLATAMVTVNIPPRFGPYSGEDDHVEVIAEYEVKTLFIHLLHGRRSNQATIARAVAGAESVEILDGIIALDPEARPGLGVTGNAQFTVTGRATVNSEGGGVDESGNPIENGNGGTAAFVSAFGLVRATEVRVVGGANRQDRFQDYDASGANPLKTNQLPLPDPMRHIPTPTVANGVINIPRGAPVSSPSGMSLNNDADSSQSSNYIYRDQRTGEDVMVLNPGIYSSIDITAGHVILNPGIYVLKSAENARYSLRIMDGSVEARGVMFYNTGRDFDPVTGEPDIFDGNAPPSGEESTGFGEIRINAGMRFSPIDTVRHRYLAVSPAIANFNGLLIYQRRQNPTQMQIQGFSEPGDFVGSVYAKWAHVRMPASGVFRSQFVTGSIRVPGHGDLTIEYFGEDVIKAPKAFLLE